VSARASEVHRFSRADLIAFAIAATVSVAALGLRQAGASGAVVFVAAAVSVMTLAYVLGEATEQAGTASGPRLASLLNATFGNLPELIIVVLTVREGLVDVARASIIGSVVGNILLVLGASILLGGLRNGTMSFDQRSVGVNASMLVLAAVALGVPSLFGHLDGTTHTEQAALSHGVAIIMAILYGAYLVYSFTQPAAPGHDGGGRWGPRAAMLTLAVTAVVTGVMSELLVSAIKPTIDEIGIGTVFVGMVVVPLVGNVPEHWAAVRIARGGNLDFSMSIAFNSGLQVALAGTAIAVVAGAAFSHEVLIVFPPLELALLGAATIMTGILASMGKANWLEGLQLLAVYAIAALAFWFL
jgi:Ca2+:H+ antiporter